MNRAGIWVFSLFVAVSKEQVEVKKLSVRKRKVVEKTKKTIELGQKLAIIIIPIAITFSVWLFKYI